MSQISVIIPAYNVEGYLTTAVESAVRQTLVPLEILIVENNSTDNTAEEARELAGRFAGIVRVLHSAEQGAPFARNRGLEMSQGKWLQFLDGDDVLLPEKLAYQFRHVSDDVGFVVSPAIDRRNGSDRIIPVMSDPWKGLFTGGGHLGYTSSILWNAMAVKACGAWDTSLKRNQEFDLMFRIMKSGYHVAIAPEAMTIRNARRVGQISEAPYADYLLSAFPFKTSVLIHALKNPQLPETTIRYLLKLYYRFYTRLRVRRPDYAREVKSTSMSDLDKLHPEKRYPMVHWHRLRSELYVIYDRVKATFGFRGLLGKLTGRH